MREPESVEMVVPDLIEKGITTFLAGPGGTNKPRLWRVTPYVCSWVKSRRNQGHNRHWPADVASPDLPVSGLHP